MKNLDNFRQSVESPKIKMRWVTFAKKIHSSAKIFSREDLSTLLLTTCPSNSRIPDVVLETTSQFSRDNSSVFFWLKHDILSTKVAHQSASFRLSTTRVKILQVSHVIFHTKIQFFFKIWINLECYDITPLYFLRSNIIYFRRKQHMKVQIFSLATARIKLHQIPYVIFRTQSQFLFIFCITFHCHET